MADQTVIFLKDWDSIEGSFPDFNTTNKSFLRMSALLKSVGIANHLFMLQLNDKDLVGVDPFDPHLPPEMMLKVAYEARNNFWYATREIGRAPARSSAHGSPIRANRGNMALYWLFMNHITTMLVQIRQTGKSFSCDWLYTWLANLRCRNSDINILTKDETLRSFNMERLKEIESQLPFYLKMRRKGEVGNTEEIKIGALGNTIKAHLPNKSPKMALNVGRGLTSAIYGIDEIAFLSNIEISLSAALAGGTAARDIARANGEPYGSLYTTTAGKKDDRDGRYAFKLLSEAAVWTEKFYDCHNLEELQEVIRRNSNSKKKAGVLRVNCTFNHRQLGYTDDWLRRAIEEAEVEGDDADRDFFNVWTSGTQSSPLTTEQSARIRQSEREPDYVEIAQAPYHYVTRWYIPEDQIESRMNSSWFVMGLDTSDAGGGDDIFLKLRDIKTGEIVASGNFNDTNLLRFSEWLFQWFVKYENFVLIPERRSTGGMIIDYLILHMVAAGIDPFKRIFNRVVQEKDEFPDRFAEIDKPMYARDRHIYDRFKKYFGFATSGSGLFSRAGLYSTTLQNAAKYTGDKVYDRILIDQILGLIIKNGRVDHADGEHDDAVIAWLLTHWMMTQATNLAFYGINSRDVLSANRVHREDNTPEKIFFRMEQQGIRDKIESLYLQLRNERDEYIASKLERDIRMLSDRLVLEDNERFSVDDLIGELRERRRQMRPASPILQPSYGYSQGPQFGGNYCFEQRGF